MTIHETAWIAPGAHVSGDVTIGPGCGVWYNAVIRGDECPISIGARSNLQDCGVIHGSAGCTVAIGDDVSIGHGAIVHGCTVEDGAMIGMGAVVLNGARVGKGALVAAGALVPEGMEIPAGMVAMGNPAKVRRPLRDAERAYLLHAAAEYAALAQNNRSKDSDEARTNVRASSFTALFSRKSAGKQRRIPSGRPPPQPASATPPPRSAPRCRSRWRRSPPSGSPHPPCRPPWRS